MHEMLDHADRDVSEPRTSLEEGTVRMKSSTSSNRDRRRFYPSSSLKLSAKVLALLADTIIAQAIDSFNSAGVAPAPFATAKALRSQVGHPTATAAAVLTNPCVFASSTSSYSNGTSTFFSFGITTFLLTSLQKK